MLLILFFTVAWAQAQNKVTGKVTNENGETLPGATIKVKGTAISAQSGSDGNFAITVNGLNDVLECSFAGLKTKEISLDGRTAVDVVLSGKSGVLSEVVVVGYGNQSRSTLTTAISKVDKKVLENVPFPNATSALQGSVSGVQVQSISGQPGLAPRVIVRGGTSINNPNGATPLYIIDGIIRTDMDNISSEDIESMQVLKDAAATAIYGARASNGVVLVTTKSGKSGQARITYNYDLTTSKVGKTYDMANAHDYIYYSRIGAAVAERKVPGSVNSLVQPSGYGTGNDLTENTGFTTQYLTPDNEHKLNEGWESMPDPVDPSKTIIYQETDWQKVLFRTGVSHNHHITASGGTDKATFNAGVGYMSNEGTAITTKYDRLSVNLNGKLKVRDNLSINARTLYSNSKDNQVYSLTDIFFRAAGLAPTAKYTFEDGSLAPGNARNMGNPAYFLNRNVYKNSIDNLTMALGADWDILPGLSFNPQVSLYKVTNDNYSFLPSYLNGVNNYNLTRAASSNYSKTTQTQADAVFNYNKSFLGKHNLTATGGFSYFGRQNYSLGASGQGAATDNIPTLNASSTPVSVTGNDSKLAVLGYFVRANYDYKMKYLLSISTRYDGASNLGENYKWGMFPGVSVGWNIHNEEFWSGYLRDNVRLKLRGSYGVTGNISGLSDFQAQGVYSVGNRYLGASAIENTVIANPLLKWEQSKTLDGGADIGLFNGRIDIIFDYYRRVTDDLITTLTLPHSTGFSSVFTNLGSLENKGYEIEISGIVTPASSPLEWRLGLNASQTKHKVLKLPYNGIPNNRVGGNYVWDPALGAYAWRGGLQEGGTLGDFYSWKQLGIYASDHDAAGAPVDMVMGFTDKTKYGGDANYADLDRNDTLDTRDLVYMGNPYPKWTGGISSSLSYKGFNLYVRADYTVGHIIYNYAKLFLAGMWAGNLNFPQEMVSQGWKQDGDIATRAQYIPGTANYSYWRGATYYKTSTNSEFYEKGNFLCLREVTLSYSIPPRVLKRVKLSGLRLNVTGSNLYYFTKYTGMNPEEGGLDQGRYPMPRNLTFGAIVSF